MDPTTTASAPVAPTSSSAPAAPQPKAAPAKATPIMDVVVQPAPAADEADAPITRPPIEDQTDFLKVTAEQPVTVTKQAHARSAAQAHGQRCRPRDYGHGR